VKEPFSFLFVQGSVGIPEVTQVDVGNLPAAVGSNADSQETIRISRQDSSTTAPPSAVFTSRAEEERWVQLLTALSEDENKGDVVVPESLVHLYHQMLSKQFDGNKKGSSARLHATWLLAELVQLAAPGKAGKRTSGVVEVEQKPHAVKLNARNGDDIVVRTVEEEDCDKSSEDSLRLRTSSDRIQEDKRLGHGSDEL
jgi:hypothetical protein